MCKTMSTVSMVTPRIYVVNDIVNIQDNNGYNIRIVQKMAMFIKYCIKDRTFQMYNLPCNVQIWMCLRQQYLRKERTMSVVQIILACFVPPYHHFKWATFVQINFGSIKFLYILTRVRVASVHVPESVSFSSSCWREQRLYCINDNIYTKEGMTTSNFVRI